MLHWEQTVGSWGDAVTQEGAQGLGSGGGRGNGRNQSPPCCILKVETAGLAVALTWKMM